MREVGILEAKTRFSALVTDVEQGGEDVTVTRHGKPVVKIVSAASAATYPRRKVSGAELAQRFQAIRDEAVRLNPASAISDSESIMTELRSGDPD